MRVCWGTSSHSHCLLLYHVMHITIWTEDWHSSPDSMASSFSHKSCSQAVVQYKWWMWASVNRNICFQSALKLLAHSPLGLGKAILCFRTRGIQHPLIKTMSSPPVVFLLLFLSLFGHPFLFSSHSFLCCWCLSGCADQTWGVRSSNRRKLNVRSEKKHLLALFHLLFSSHFPLLSTLWTSWARWRV